MSLETGERKKLFDADSSVLYASPGYLLFRRERSLVARSFDAERLRLTGEAFPVAEEVRTEPDSSAAVISVSQNGHLAYQSGASALSQLMWVDRSGAVIANVGPPANYMFPSVSHDGRKAAVSIIDPGGATDDIWIVDLARGMSNRLTFDPDKQDLRLHRHDTQQKQAQQSARTKKRCGY